MIERGKFFRSSDPRVRVVSIVSKTVAWREIYLIYNWFDLWILEQSGDLLGIKITDANVLRQTFGKHILHSPPRVDVVYVTVGEGIFGSSRKEIVTLLVSVRPVYQVEVHVIETEASQRFPQSRFHQFGPVIGIPQLAGNEQILSLHGTVRYFLPYSNSNLILILINVSAIEMPVADVDGIFHRLSNFSWFGLK